MCTPTSISTIRKLSKNNVIIHKKTKRSSTRLYDHPWWRVVKTKINLNSKVKLEKDVVVAVDSTGIKVTNRAEPIPDLWNNKRKRKLSMKVTKEDVNDGKILKKLVRDVFPKNKNIQKILADEEDYDSKENFEYIDKLKITRVIKVRKNSSIKNNINFTPRKLSALEQFKDIKRWKKKYGYGYRWMAESVFSSIKRTFGEHISSVKWSNIVNELMLKPFIYSKFIENTTV